jgi:hypothetical protein
MPKWFLRIVSNIEMKKLIEKYYSKKEWPWSMNAFILTLNFLSVFT